MSKLKTVARGSVIGISAVLAGAFIYYRGTHSGSGTGSGSGSTSTGGQGVRDAANDSAESARPMMGGSKRMEMFTEEDSPLKQDVKSEKEKEADRIIFSSSKSGPVALPSEFKDEGSVDKDKAFDPPASAPSTTEGG